MVSHGDVGFKLFVNDDGRNLKTSCFPCVTTKPSNGRSRNTSRSIQLLRTTEAL